MRLRNFKRRRLGIFIITLICITVGVFYLSDSSIFTSNMAVRPLIAGVVGPVDGIQPGVIVEPQERLISSAIYEGLVYYEENSSTLKPLLAKEWEYSKDGKTLNIRLKNEVLFHNGQKMTAEKVKKAWEKNFLINKSWSNLVMLHDIIGTTDFINGKTQGIDGIEAKNDSNLVINFSRPNAVFVFYLTNPLFWVADFDPEDAAPSGTGPYKLAERSPDKISLLRNETYHRGQPNLTGVEILVFEDAGEALNAYKEGKLDYLDQVPGSNIEEISQAEEYKDLVIKKPVLEYYCLGFNQNNQPFAGNYLLRRALNYAVDREAMIKNVFGGGYIIARGAIPQGIPGYRDDIVGYSYNEQRANQLLAEAGFENRSKLRPLYLTYNKDEGHTAMANELMNQLKKIGVEVQLQQLDWETYKKQLARMGISFFRLSWRADYPDADNFLYSLFHSTNVGISNFSGYRNPQVDQLLDASRAEFDFSKRIKLLQRAEDIIIDDAPHLWLFQKEACKLIGKDVNRFHLNCLELLDWYELELLEPELEG